MSKIKVLNLYAGLGGNRKLWQNVEVTAVEIEEDIAKAYKHFFPNDKIIIADAHEFLLKNYKDYDFIWSSPPCPTHSKLRKANFREAQFPDMKLYEEILFLQGYFKGKWVIENVISWYEPLIKPFVAGNHYFWSNFIITDRKNETRRAVSVNSIKEKEKIIGFNLDNFSFKNINSSHKKDKVINNCVEPELGKHIFNMAFKEEQKTL